MLNKTKGIFIPIDLLQEMFLDDAKNKVTKPKSKTKNSKNDLYPCRVETTVTQETKNELIKLSKHYRVPMRDLIREAINNWISNRHDYDYEPNDMVVIGDGVA